MDGPREARPEADDGGSALGDLPRALAEIPVDQERVFGEAAERISRLVGDLCAIAVLDANGDRLEPVAVSHRDPAAERGVEAALSSADLDPAAWPLARRALQSSEPVLIANLSARELRELVNPSMRPYVEEREVSSLLLLPVRARGQTVGIVGLAREGAQRPYTADDQTVVQAVVDGAALTLDNARLVRALRRQSELDAALLAAQSDLGEGVVVLDLTTRRLVHANEAFAATVGYSQQELEALPSFLDLVPVEEVAQWERRLAARRRGEGIVAIRSATLVRRDGARIEVEVSTKPLGEDGERLVALVRDVTERERSEREARLQAEVLDQVDAAVIRLDGEGTVVHWNRGAERLLGWPAGEAQERPFGELSVIGEAGEVGRILKAVSEAGVFEGETAARRRDGASFTAFTRVVAVGAEEGRASGYVGVAVDATAPRRARDELEESRERFRAQYKGLPIPTYTWRREGEDFVLVDFNEAARRFTEGHIDDLMGIRASELYGHDPRMLSELRESLVARGSMSRELDFPMPSLGVVRRLAVTYVYVSSNIVMVHAEDVTARREAEARLRFQAELLDHVDAAVIAVDADGTVTHWNKGACELFGWSAQEALGASIVGLAALTEMEGGQALMGRIGNSEWPWEAELRVRRGQELVPVYARTAPVVGDDGEPIGYVGVSVDISERERAEERLREAEIRYRTLLEHLPAITYVSEGGLEGRWRYVSPQVESMLGYTAEEWQAQPGVWLGRLHPEDRDRVKTEVSRAEASGEPIEIEYRILTKSGEVRWVRHEAVVHRGEDGEDEQNEGLLTDITERKGFESQLQYLADHDALTGLWNRRRFLEGLAHEVRLVEREREPGCVLLLDIDNFKYVNDSLGHQAGDSLIRSVAGILRRRLRAADTLARLGGDEFAVLLHATSTTEATPVAEELLAGVRERVHLVSAEPVHITASIGLAEIEAGTTAEAALAAADLAMYDAKRAGRDQLAIFSPELRLRAGAGRSWAEQIRDALDRDGFRLFWQPIVDLRTGAVDQHELLVRMRGEGDEMVPPDSFLPMAERFDLVQAIDRWVVGEAIRLIGERRRSGSPLRVAVNVSGRSLSDPRLTRFLQTELARSPAEPDDLVLEVAETAAIANMDGAREFAERVTRLGCRMALDDFGSGFGSFYYLKHLPVHYLKIDGDFVRKLDSGRVDREVVQAIVRLAGSVGTQTIAEFVGDQPTLDLVSSYGVDYAQGYHVGRPRPLSPSGTSE